MHFSFLALSLLVGSVVTFPIKTSAVTRRDTTIADAYLTRMSADLQTLKVSLKSLPSGGSQDIATQRAKRLLEELKTLGRTMEVGARDVRTGPSVTALETLSLTGQVTMMSSLVNDVTVGFNTENTKRMIWTAGKKDAQKEFAQELARNSRAYSNFATSLISRLPVLEQGLAGIFKSAFGALVEPAVAVSSLALTITRIEI
jgi:phosphosulfolactate synthase (CoM biosynthesis protein A)